MTFKTAKILFIGILVGISMPVLARNFDGYHDFFVGLVTKNEARLCEDGTRATWKIGFHRAYSPFWYSICDSTFVYNEDYFTFHALSYQDGYEWSEEIEERGLSKLGL